MSLPDGDRPRVLIREQIAEAGVELLRQRFDVVEDGESELASIIDGFDAIVIRSATTLDAELIARGERLKVIARAGVGVDNVDVDAATRRGIVVANAPESTVISAAEVTVASGAFATTIPRRVAASTSTLSTPTPARPITLSLVARSMSSALSFVAERMTIPS